jgi:hypothetical protein
MAVPTLSPEGRLAGHPCYIISAVHSVGKRSTKDSLHDAIGSSLLTDLTPLVPSTKHQKGVNGVIVIARHHTKYTYVGVEVELRPLYTAEKERCVPIVSKRCAVRRLGLGVMALSAVKLRSFSA